MRIRLLYCWSILHLGLLLRCQVAAAVEDEAKALTGLVPRVTVPAPIIVAASQDWDGNDGPWSSFAIQVGTPSQNIKVLAATSVWETMAVMPAGCTTSDPSTCENDRGFFYRANTSSTWVMNTASLKTNVYPVGIDERLGYTGKASLGFDDITLGWPGSGGPKLKNQTVGSFITKEHYFGVFGLSPRAANFTSFDNPIPSYVQNLVNQSIIPSTSWSYTAGNQYRFNKVLGSLILGGYDSSKFVPNDVVFGFNDEDIRDLTVQIESITTDDGKTPLLSASIPALMDSGDSCIWLPQNACTLFEKAFGLTWDEKTELYLLSAAQHTALLAKNPSVTFKLGNLTAGANVDITLPYSAFDLNVSSPIVPESTSYFPLKRAVNETQYTLGRTFFQEAYLIADYDRRTFSVSQAAWVAGAQSKIVSIAPPSADTGNGGSSGINGTDSATTSTSKKPVPVAAIAGGIGGGVVLLIVVAVLVFFFYIKPRRQKAEKEKAAAEAADYTAIDPTTGARVSPTPMFTGFKAELDNSEAAPKHEMDGGLAHWVVEADGCERMRYEVDGKTFIYEKDDGGRTIVYEMDAREKGVWLVEADGTPVPVYEMAALEEVAHEMHGQRDSIHEISPPTTTRRNPRYSWETSDGTLVGSPPTANAQVSPDSATVISPQTAETASPRSWRARLQRMPE